MSKIITIFRENLIERFKDLPLDEIKLEHTKIPFNDYCKAEVVRVISDDYIEVKVLKDRYVR